MISVSQLVPSSSGWMFSTRADGYVFVTPEYNHGMSGALKDAIDYIGHQIMKKAIYGR